MVNERKAAIELDPARATAPASRSGDNLRQEEATGGFRLPAGALAALVLLFLLLLVLGLGLVRAQQGPVATGMKAPEFSLTTFEGEQISSDSLSGQVVVVNFWASWCIPCEEEAAELEAAWRNFADQGVVFLGVNYVDTEPEAMAYMRKFDITYPSGPDLGTRMAQAFRIRGVPETFIIAGDGTIVAARKGPYSSQAEVEQAIELALAH